MTNLNHHQIFRLNGKHMEVLDGLVEEGYFANKTEAIRGGLLELGTKYGLLGEGNGDTVKFKEGNGGNGHNGGNGKGRKQ